MPETEAIDRLYLELSQFTKAKTAREIALEGLIARSHDWICQTIELSAEEGTSIDSLADNGPKLLADLLAALKS